MAVVLSRFSSRSDFYYSRSHFPQFFLRLLLKRLGRTAFSFNFVLISAQMFLQRARHWDLKKHTHSNSFYIELETVLYNYLCYKSH